VKILMMGAFLLWLYPAAVWAQEPYVPGYNYLASYPDETTATLGWNEDVQGITHDDDHWYITQKERLWKIPVTCNFGSGWYCLSGGILIKDLRDFPALSDYNHFGDPAYWNPACCYPDFKGPDFVVAPLEGNGVSPAIGVFRADDLSYAGHVPLPGQNGAAGWVAIDPEGALYSSDSITSVIRRYSLNWNDDWQVTDMTLSHEEDIHLEDEAGNELELFILQGGAFSPDGGFLVLSNGYMTGSTCEGVSMDEDLMRAIGGIHVFDAQSWRRIRKSTNGYGTFNFEFHPGGATCEEPQGLTIWDLEDGRAPGIRGQLHALLLDNDFPDADDVYLKHYTDSIYVDGGYAGDENGTVAKPYNTVGEANAVAWDGAQIRVLSDPVSIYPETLNFATPLRVLAERGPIRIGDPTMLGRSASSPSDSMPDGETAPGDHLLFLPYITR
jgi:hypothetical protein